MTPKPSSFKKKRDKLAEKHSDNLSLVTLGSDKSFKAGYNACLRSQLVKDMATALEMADNLIETSYALKAPPPEQHFVRNAIEAYKKEVAGE